MKTVSKLKVGGGVGRGGEQAVGEGSLPTDCVCCGEEVTLFRHMYGIAGTY